MSEDDLDNTAATYAGAKRTIAALQQEVQNLKEAGPKRKS